MPLTTRVPRALASVLLAAGVALAAVAPAAATPSPPVNEGVRAASAGEITPGAGPVAAAIVVPITLPPTAEGLIPADRLAQQTGPFGILTRQLDAVAGTPAAIGVDPMILASIRVLGASAPLSATQWLARLDAASNEVFTLAYADADVVAAVRTGTLGDLAPTGFGFALDAEDFPAQPVEPAPLPDATPEDPAAPPLPTTEELLAWTTTLPAIAWPADPGLGAADAEALGRAGYTEVVVSSEDLDDPRTPLVELDGIRGVVADAPLSALIAAAAATVTASERAAALDALEAALARETAAAAGRGVVLALPRGAARGPGLADALARLGASTSVRLVTLAEVLATTPQPASLGDGVPSPEREDAFARLAEAAQEETAFSSVLVDPVPLLDIRRLDRIALYGSGWGADETAWRAAVAAFEARSDEILGSVRIERGSDALLLARNTDFRVSVSNALPYAITVRVGVDPRSPILQVQDAVDLTVEPEATGTAYLPVEAVANGEVTVQTTLTSPTGVPIDDGLVRVTVQAEWEGIGTLVVVLVLVLVFGAGIARTVVTRLRARRTADRADEAEDADA